MSESLLGLMVSALRQKAGRSLALPAPADVIVAFGSDREASLSQEPAAAIAGPSANKTNPRNKAKFMIFAPPKPLKVYQNGCQNSAASWRCSSLCGMSLPTSQHSLAPT